ncbi:hypothetical protein TYRP_013194 [Tyrophagus putrescentiae]|nr:hypothetical protein TYRP_013194 [Tyrophagus putrescentiae]
MEGGDLVSESPSLGTKPLRKRSTHTCDFGPCPFSCAWDTAALGGGGGPQTPGLPDEGKVEGGGGGEGKNSRSTCWPQRN